MAIVSDMDVLRYLRHERTFPHIWCPGCGIGIIMHALVRAIARLELEQDKVAVLSGIGCAGRMTTYLNFDTMHTTHGRTLAFATGLKMARPELHVLAVMGDGDAIAIGGNHFVHTARRNIDITAIVVNNQVYGMTGGQVSPTTPLGSLATTAPHGNIDYPMPICDLAIAAGASFVARSTVYHARQLDQVIERALRKKGFSLVEVVAYCHTSFGRMNRLGNAVEMMRLLRENSVAVEQAVTLSAKELAGKVVHGVLCDRELPEYIELYQQMVARAQARELGQVAALAAENSKEAERLG